MTTIERLRLTVIEELIEGRINGTTAANRLNISVRQIKRLKKRFMKEGHDSLIHGSRGEKVTENRYKYGKQKLFLSSEKNIMILVPTMTWEKLQEVHGIPLSDETIRAII